MTDSGPKNIKRYLFYKFAGGLAAGVGTALGATLIFALLLGFLSQLQIIPVVGDWIKALVDYIKSAG